jgi:hypothetical protein
LRALGSAGALFYGDCYDPGTARRSRQRDSRHRAFVSAAPLLRVRRAGSLSQAVAIGRCVGDAAWPERVIGEAFFWRKVVEVVFQLLINVSGDHTYSLDPTPPYSPKPRIFQRWEVGSRRKYRKQHAFPLFYSLNAVAPMVSLPLYRYVSHRTCSGENGSRVRSFSLCLHHQLVHEQDPLVRGTSDRPSLRGFVGLWASR